ncbi:site-specific integrase [Dyadobacter sp.]|uniref:site-specific integrase n=1 Tax=Dyadobacter sp. TaxID=1914288 RepID=UPI003F6F3CC9
MNAVTATDFSLGIQAGENWHGTEQRFIGNDQDIIELNERLEEIRSDIRLVFRNLSKTSIPSVNEVRRVYLNKTGSLTLLEVSKAHINKIKSRSGFRGYSKGTLKAHQTMHQHIVKFFASTNRKDILLSQIDNSFGHAYIDFLRFKQKYTQNFIVKSLNRLKFLIDQAVNAGKLDRNPLAHLKEEKEPPGEIYFLTESEIESLKDNPLFSPAQTRVADTFLFQCFTGLSYCDLSLFSPEKHLFKDNSGRLFIRYSRKKTDRPFVIPVLKYAKYLIDKYDGKIPVLTNQKMNEYLKEIASITGIKINLTTHIGRKTAGTYLLNRDVPMESVSKILGHSSMKITEKMYAHLLPETILRHTAHLM